MITNELIAQINALAKKQKTVGLTDEEKKKQAHLRKVYLEGIRGQVKDHLSRIRYED